MVDSCIRAYTIVFFIDLLAGLANGFLSHKIDLLLLTGLLFPGLALITTLNALYSSRRYHKFNPPLFVPFTGALILSVWVFKSAKPGWLYLVVWFSDVGTIGLVIVGRRLILQWWDTCSVTKVLELHGSKETELATLSLHSTGRYYLRKKWQRPAGEIGIMGLGERGSFIKSDDGFRITADSGWVRELVCTVEGKFRVFEDENVAQSHADYAIADWLLDKSK